MYMIVLCCNSVSGLKMLVVNRKGMQTAKSAMISTKDSLSGEPTQTPAKVLLNRTYCYSIGLYIVFVVEFY